MRQGFDSGILVDAAFADTERIRRRDHGMMDALSFVEGMHAATRQLAAPRLEKCAE